MSEKERKKHVMVGGGPCIDCGGVDPESHCEGRQLPRCEAFRDSHGVDRQCLFHAGHAGDHESYGSAARIRWKNRAEIAQDASGASGEDSDTSDGSGGVQSDRMTLIAEIQSTAEDVRKILAECRTIVEQQQQASHGD